MSGDEEWTLAFQGAESRIKFGVYDGKPAVMKERFEKKYRHPELDKQLTRTRQRAEVKAINKIREKCPELALIMPEILKTTERTIIMTRIENSQTSCRFIGSALKSSLDITWLFEDIGKLIGQIHSLGIIHGDLTTSNILVNEKNQLIPIDFGLSSSSTSNEDRGVDLYVLERALLSTHVEENSFQIVLKSYENKMGPLAAAAIKKYNEVRMRGRKRLMVG